MRYVVSFLVAAVIIIAMVSGLSGQRNSDRTDHVKWVANALKEIDSIKVGMTRRDLLRVFTTEGGISTASSRQYVYKDCPYFKVQVKFQLAADASNKLQESPDDKIIEISRPYLESSISD